METPPPFNPPSYSPPPPKKSRPGLVIGIVIAAILVCCGGPVLLLGGGGLWAYNKFQPFLTCAISLPEARNAILAYEREKGHFPAAETWQTDVAPYYKRVVDSAKSKDKRGPFKAWNFDENLICTSEPSPTGIAYNEELAGKKLSDLKDPNSTYVLFEVAQTGMNLHQKFERRPKSSYPKMMDKPRPWLEVPVSGQMEGGDSSIRVSSDTDSDGDGDSGDSAPAKASDKKGGKAKAIIPPDDGV